MTFLNAGKTCPNQSTYKKLRDTCLKQTDIVAIAEFGKELGISDRETQINNILYFQNQIRIKINELKKEKKEKCRLYTSLGLTSGIFIGILFI